jgi:hypothetical protein
MGGAVGAPGAAYAAATGATAADGRLTALAANATASAGAAGGADLVAQGLADLGNAINPFPVGPDSAYAIANGLPDATDVQTILAANSAVAAVLGAPNAVVLGAGTQGAVGAAEATGEQDFTSTITWTFAAAGLTGDVTLGLVGSDAPVSDIGTVEFTAALGGTQVVDRSFTDLGDAESFFDDNPIDLGAVGSVGTSGTETVTVTFTLTADGDDEGFGEQFLLGAVACFAAGTRISTTRGEINVEKLREGDIVRTREGTQPIVWIGHRRIDLLRHPHPEKARPIKIRRHAFAQNVPARDLLVSPDHAIFHNSALIPAKLLLNGRTVVQTRPRAITYFHIELPRHDILFAENQAAESYLDTGNRGLFANAETPFILHPGFAIHRWDDTCAPMVLDGAKLAATRAHLLARADRLGHATTTNPDLHLLADGRRIDAQHLPDGRLRLAIPKGARDLRLASRSAIPAEQLCASTDRRRLGVCVAAIEFVTPAGRQELALDDPALTAGWHNPETAWRWTTGEAHLALAGPALLHITLTSELPYIACRAA